MRHETLKPLIIRYKVLNNSSSIICSGSFATDKVEQVKVFQQVSSQAWRAGKTVISWLEGEECYDTEE